MTGELHRGEGLREIAHATSSGGNFSFDEDDLRALIKKWRDLADSYVDSVVSAESMTIIDPPGDDFASKSHARAANASGTSYLEYLKHNARYCESQAHLFQQALDDYLGVEHANKTKIDDSGGEV